jgi:hypothetical protein
MGFKLCIVAGEGLFTAAKAIDNYLGALREFGTLAQAGDSFMQFGRFSEVLDIDRYLSLEEKHIPIHPKIDE